MGKVIYGDYQLCLSYWTNTAARIGMFDFVVMGKAINFVLAFMPQPPDYDSFLFTRPFRNEVWCMIGITAIVVIFIIILSSIIFRKRRNNENLRIIIAVGWLTYLLIRDKYSSAYTT